MNQNMQRSRGIALPLELDALCEANKPGTPRGPEEALASGKHVSGGSFEHLQHVLLGGKPLWQPRYAQTDWCAAFEPNEQFPGSPCTADVVKRETTDALTAWNDAETWAHVLLSRGPGRRQALEGMDVKLVRPAMPQAEWERDWPAVYNPQEQ